MSKGAYHIRDLFPLRLLGFGLYFAWTLLIPSFEKVSGVAVFSSSLARLCIFSTVTAAALVAFACHARSSDHSVWSNRVVLLLGIGAALAPALDLVALFLPVGGAFFDMASLMLRALADAGLFLAWNSQLARHKAYVACVAYSGSLAIGAIGLFMVTAIGYAALLAGVILLPLASCALLLMSQALYIENEIPRKERRVSWSLPWRPVILISAFALAYNIAGHLDGNVTHANEIGLLAIALATLGCLVAFFDHFDGSLLYKISPVLVIAGLLLCGIPSAGTVPGLELRSLVVSAGYYGFVLYLYLTLNSACYRYEIPAAWPFGIVQATCAMAAIPASALGNWLAVQSSVHSMNVLIVLDAAVVIIALLSMLFLTGKEPTATWGIRAKQAPENSQADMSRASNNTQGYLENHVLRCALVARHYGLTHREEEVLSLITQGQTFQQIEANLSIAHGTMRAHAQHIYSKLGVHSYEEAQAAVTAWKME